MTNLSLFFIINDIVLLIIFSVNKELTQRHDYIMYLNINIYKREYFYTINERQYEKQIFFHQHIAFYSAQYYYCNINEIFFLMIQCFFLFVQ